MYIGGFIAVILTLFICKIRTFRFDFKLFKIYFRLFFSVKI
jgi:hypothetical protein